VHYTVIVSNLNNHSGFKTNAITRPDVIIPTGMLDILVILQRGNLVKTFSVVIVVAICECSSPFPSSLTNANPRDDNTNPAPCHVYLRILWLSAKE
jgi:hypothetical protein